MLPMAVIWRPSPQRRVELGNTETVGPAAQFRSDHQIRNVKCDSIDEGRVIGAGEVINGAGKPSAQSHAEQCEEERHANAPPCISRLEKSAYDNCIGRDYATLRQAE